MSTLAAPQSAMSTSQLFEARLFTIPDFQRGYAWEQLQRDEFLEDLELLAAGAIHFTGTIVLSPSSAQQQFKDRKGKTYQVSAIVDGQQRLTTIIMLLDAIRREMVALNQMELAQGLEEMYISVDDRNGAKASRLTLNSDSHEFFFNHVLLDTPALDGPRIRSHRNLIAAKHQFAEYFATARKARGTAYGQWLEGLRDKVCEQLAFSVYQVHRAADAGVIFEVMNNRGKPITELEKTKNYLLYLAGKLQLPAESNLADSINDTWAHIFRELMSNGLSEVTNEDQLLRSHWLMTFDHQERNWNGSKSIKSRFHLREYVGKHEKLLADLTEYVKSLRNATSAYCDIAQPRHPNAFQDFKTNEQGRQDVIQHALKFARLRTTAPFLPLLMAIRLKYAGKPALYKLILELCEKFAFRVYRFLQRRPTAGRSSLFLLGNGVYDSVFKPEEAGLVLLSLINKYSPTADMEAGFSLTDDENDWYNWRGLTYFLYEYETYLAARRNKNLAINWSHLEREDARKHTIEHILPQTPEDGYWTERFDPKLRRKYQHDIGNLCLTLDNSSYGRKPFPEKRGEVGSGIRCYADGDLLMERDLASYSEWNENTLLSRRQKIIEWAKERWGVPLVKAPADEVDAPSEGEEADLEVPVDIEG